MARTPVNIYTDFWMVVRVGLLVFLAWADGSSKIARAPILRSIFSACRPSNGRRTTLSFQTFPSLFYDDDDDLESIKFSTPHSGLKVREGSVVLAKFKTPNFQSCPYESHIFLEEENIKSMYTETKNKGFNAENTARILLFG